MNNILIIYPHWPPSNLVGVHRVRLIANHLSGYGWQPHVLTVHPDCYEEKPDQDMLKLVSKSVKVYHVKAFGISRPRIIGDIGLRAFFQLKKGALNLLREKNFDFIWISIPSFYTALLGRSLYRKTKTPYGIDYQDPWIRDISNRNNLRARLSLFLAKVLEPYAVKKASLITGVSEAYYKPVIARNFAKKSVPHAAMPLGFDHADHTIAVKNINYPWDDYPNCIPYIYAGAFLPKSGLFTDLLFKAIAELKKEGRWNEKMKLFFIGTGNYFHKSIKDYAEENLVNEQVVEIRERFPFLHILNFLSAAQGVLLIGSTEKHYTASKTYQSLLSGRPVFSILHAESTAVDVFKECKADTYLVQYQKDISKTDLFANIKATFSDFIESKKKYEPGLDKLENYSARKSAEVLAEVIHKLIP